MREQLPRGNGKRGRIAALYFLVLLSVLLLFGRRDFYRSDGLLQYRDGEALCFSGSTDRDPWFAGRDARYALGTDGRAHSLYGIAPALHFAATIGLQQALDRITGRKSQLPEKSGKPDFVATQANLPVVAMLAVILFLLLSDMGIGIAGSLVAPVLAVFGSMVVVYATLSYDMPLAASLLMGGILFFFRACRSFRARDGALAAICFGAALHTRINTVIFFPVIGLYALYAAWSAGEQRRRLLGPAALFSLVLALACAALGWYNYHRFGGILETGYTPRHGRAYRFDASLTKAIPALLASPGRGLLFFAPFLVFALAGIPALLRRRRAEGLAVLAMALVNFLFFAKNHFWHNIPSAWGPRYQFATVVLLMVPFGFWIEEVFRRGRKATRALTICICLGAVALQLAVLAAGFHRTGIRVWEPGASQIAGSLGELASLVREGRWSDLMFWYAASQPRPTLSKELLVAAVLSALLAGFFLVREVRRIESRGRESRDPGSVEPGEDPGE